MFAPQESFFIIDPMKNRGINCRFGSRGSVLRRHPPLNHPMIHCYPVCKLFCLHCHGHRSLVRYGTGPQASSQRLTTTAAGTSSRCLEAPSATCCYRRATAKSCMYHAS